MSDLAIADKRLKHLNMIIDKQRAYADLYTRTLTVEKGMLCMEKPGTFYNRYLYPIIFQSSAERDQVAMYLHEHHIGTARPYSDIAAVAARHYGYKGDCPVSEQVADRILVIPSYYRLDENDIKFISYCLNNFFSKTK